MKTYIVKYTRKNGNSFYRWEIDRGVLWHLKNSILYIFKEKTNEQDFYILVEILAFIFYIILLPLILLSNLFYWGRFQESTNTFKTRSDCQMSLEGRMEAIHLETELKARRKKALSRCKRIKKLRKIKYVIREETS